MSGIVLDASVTMSWCFEDETTSHTEAVLDRVAADSAVVPTLWRLEIANALLSAERRQRLHEAQTARFVALLEQLPIEVDSEAASIAALTAAGRAHALSAYDAEYLVLAARRGLPLATCDQRLQSACVAAEVSLAAR